MYKCQQAYSLWTLKTKTETCAASVGICQQIVESLAYAAQNTQNRARTHTQNRHIARLSISLGGWKIYEAVLLAFWLISVSCSYLLLWLNRYIGLAGLLTKYGFCINNSRFPIFAISFRCIDFLVRFIWLYLRRVTSALSHKWISILETKKRVDRNKIL